MMKKLFLLLIFSGCSHDCPEFDPCDCIIITDPVSFQSTNANGQIVHTTYFVGKNECKGISELMDDVTTNINEIPKEFDCYE